MFSSNKLAKFEYLEEKARRNESDRLRNKARGILYEQGKIGGLCGTDEDIRQKERLINNKAFELKEREEFDRLKKKYG